MKKLLSVILTIAVCLSVCACAKGGEDNSSAVVSDAAESVEDSALSESAVISDDESVVSEETAATDSDAESSAESTAEESSEEESAFDINDYIGKWVNGKRVSGIYDYEFKVEKVKGDKVYFNWYKREASMMDGSLYAMSLTNGTVSGKLVGNKTSTKLVSWDGYKTVTMTVTLENDKITVSGNKDWSGMWFEMFDAYPPRTLVFKRA